MATTEVTIQFKREESIKLKSSRESGVSKKVDESQKKRRGGSGRGRGRSGSNNARRKEKERSKPNAGDASRKDGRSDDVDTKNDQSSGSDIKFDCSSAIAKICDSVFVSAVSGTRMGPCFEATLLEKGVTALVSTTPSINGTQHGSSNATKATNSVTTCFEHHSLDIPEDSERGESVLRPLHEACDFIDEAIAEGGVVFIHSRASFSRSDWAVLLVLGYMMKYQSCKLVDAMESTAEAIKHTVIPADKFRRDLVQFELDALGEISVSEEWIAAGDHTLGGPGSKTHSLNRRKLAENLNDRRLLKKKSPHK